MASERIYSGRSMGVTFGFGDRLMVDTAAIDEIQPGEVVIYRHQDCSGSIKEVVHRVVRVVEGGLETQGDSNSTADSVLVTPENLVGRVTCFTRDGKRRNLNRRNHFRQHVRMRSAARSILRVFFLFILILGRRVYGRVRESGLISALWRPAIQKGLFMTPCGPAFKYIHRNRTVGTCWVRGGPFRRRKPYDLVLGAAAGGMHADSAEEQTLDSAETAPASLGQRK